MTKRRKRTPLKGVQEELRKTQELIASYGINPNPKRPLRGVEETPRYHRPSPVVPSSEFRPTGGDIPIRPPDPGYDAAVEALSSQVAQGYNKGGLEFVTDLDTIRNNGRGRL